jgi:hypothetical protein
MKTTFGGWYELFCVDVFGVEIAFLVFI